MPRVCLELYMLKIKIAPRSLQNGDVTITIMVLFHYRFAGFFFDANEIALGGLCLRFQAPEKEKKMERIIKDTTGGRLKFLRENEGLTLKELGFELGISKSLVCMYEGDQRILPSDILLKSTEVSESTLSNCSESFALQATDATHSLGVTFIETCKI